MQKRPNLLFILNDHQAYYGHGMDGGVKPLRPNFEKLAAQGATFLENYAVTPMCGPARRSFLTGLYPHTHGQVHNENDPPYRHEVYLDTLAAGGYRNFYYGKWHAGPGCAYDHHADGLSQSGYGNPYNMPEYAAYLKRKGLPRVRHLVESDYRHPGFDENRYFLNMHTGEEFTIEDFFSGPHAYGVTTTPKETHEAFYLASLACDKLEELAEDDSGQPFALRVDFWGPHQPFFPTREYLDLYDPSKITPYPSLYDDLADKPEVLKDEATEPFGKNRKIIQPTALSETEWQTLLAHCYAHITMVDDAAGQILDKLKELGLDENTLVIWTTDHGDAIACHGGHFDKDSHMAMEVIKTPLTAVWPGHIKPGTYCSEYTCTFDVPVTLLDAAGMKFEKKVDGVSLMDVLAGKSEAIREQLMLETYGHGYGTTIRGRTILHEGWKYACTENDLDELYDLKNDPYEMRNLASLPEYAEERRVLRELLRREQRRSGDPVALEAICPD